MSKSQGFQINWLGSAGSALGAVSSAVLLSTLGAAGTLFGAALGSLIITVGGSIYTQSLQKTKDRVVKAGDHSNGASKHAEAPDVDDTLRAAESSEDPDEAPKKSLPWKRIVGLTVGLFVVAMALILAFELSTGRPVSSFTGGSDTDSGTTFSRLGSSNEKTETPEADENDETTETEKPTKDDPTQEEPAEEKPAEEDPIEEKPADPPPAEEPPAEAPPAEAPPADSDE